MINFNDINYERTDFEEIKEKINSLIDRLSNENNFSSYLEIFREIISYQSHIEELADYADIRNMRNSKDQFFKEELEYWDEFKPRYDLLFIPFYKLALNSPFQEKLKKVIPDNFFNTIKYKLRISDDSIISLQQKENQLKAKYRELNRSLISFNNEERPLSFVTSFFSSNNREIRKNAHDAVNDFYLSKKDQYDEIFYEMVNVRGELARKLGFSDYSEYSLYSLRRFGYDYSDIRDFRENILEYFSPIIDKINEWKKDELSINHLEYFDTIYFNEMPKPLYNDQQLLTNLEESFMSVDKDLYNLYCIMLKNNYIDLIPNDNKLNIGITNYLTDTCMPTITGNLKGTSYDVEVTTHEVGHAFQKYCASKMDKNYIVSPLLKYPTFDIAEMFSYAMELIMMDHVDNIFNDEDYQKYCFLKIKDMVSTLPYICLVDEFQEKVYKCNNLKKDDPSKIWLELVSKYHLEVSNSGHQNLDNGGYFYRQSHIFMNPLYYIDYALSYFGAFSIWNNSSLNLEFFKEIGSVASYYPLNDLISKYHLENPFSSKNVEFIGNLLDKELETRKINVKTKFKK